MAEQAAATTPEATPTTNPTEPTSTPTPGSQPEGNAATGIFAQENTPEPEVPEVTPTEAPATHAPAPEQTTAPAEPEPASPTAPEPAEAAPAERVVPKPEEYVLPEGIPSNIREFAHASGYTQEQLDGAVQHFGGYIQAAKSARQNALRELGEAHLKNWGADAQTKLSVAKRALAQNDADGKLAQALNESGYGNHPAVLDFLYTLGKGMQEGGFLKGANRRPPGQKTAAQALFGGTHSSVE